MAPKINSGKKTKKAAPAAEVAIVSDTGDDAHGEAELANFLRDVPDDAPMAVVEDEGLTRDERDQEDDPQFFEDVLKFETARAEEELEARAKVAESALKWDAPKAYALFKGTTTKLVELGVFTPADKDIWDEQASGLKTHYDVFSAQVGAIYKALELAYAKAERNYKRLAKISAMSNGFFEKNSAWMECMLRVAKDQLAVPHSSAMPNEEGFIPQAMTNDDRERVYRRIDQMLVVSKVATCEGCGKWVAVDKDGEPFKSCQGCRKAKKEAEELADLNLKLADKNKLLIPLNELLVELNSAAAYWVDDQVRLGRSKAQIALDIEFKHQIAWLTKQVAELWVSVKVTAISDADRAAVEKLAGFISAENEKVRMFKHLTWCNCGAPTYKWRHPKKGTMMEAGLKCEECRRADKQLVAKLDSASEVDAETLEEAARNAGVSLELSGRKPVVAKVADDESEDWPKPKKTKRPSKRERAQAEEE